jgi:NodT family efflux transporter outer membrane factor (OMF) lipoprotein
MYKNLISLILILFQTSCVLGPDYHFKEEQISQEWLAPEAEEVEISDQEPIADWWTIFNDPLLNKYIEEAQAYNNDVIIAQANVCKARAARNAAASVFYPQIYHDFNDTRQAFSKNGPLFLFGDAFPGDEAFAIPRYQTLYTFLFDATWEIDLFGKNIRNLEAAQDNLCGAYENLNDVLLSVFAEVARIYVEVRSNQQNIDLIEKNIGLLQRTVNLISNRVKAGLDNSLNLERVEAELFNLKATLPQAKVNLVVGIYSLSILLGELPECLFDELIVPQALPEVPQMVAVGLRSDLLRRRPDVRRAEWNLAAATANIGVAVASFFPSFVLSGNLGLQSLHLNNLFAKGSTIWAIAGDINTPFFTGGKLTADLDMSRADTCIALSEYEKAVLNAVKDAETALAAFTQDLVAVRDYSKAMERYQHLVSLNNERYTKGLVNLTDLIDSERQMVSSELNTLEAQTASLVDLIALYKALAGGWCYQ